MAVGVVLWTGVVAAFAAEHRVNMVDSGPDGIMVFDPSFLKVNKGDTVKFVVKDMGHNIISHVVPGGAQTWKGTVNQDLTVTLDHEGVYIVECDLHTPLGMVGVIQVGKPVNLDAAKAAAAKMAQGMAMNAERLEQYLARVK
jgi:pseudoazurin